MLPAIAPGQFGLCLALLLGLPAVLSAQTSALATPADLRVALEKYCFECHGGSKSKGDINLEHLLARPSLGSAAEAWESVAGMVETAEMPPADEASEFPTDSERAAVVDWIRSSLRRYEAEHASEPGRVTVRRLTSGEYAYAIADLTGIDVKTGIDGSSDSVGGEGFTNFGDVQFVEDANIERYLEAAKEVADHAVIGAGPLQFYADPGRTGLELSALQRINELYATRGFRVVSGEGGRPFGLERYGKAFFVAWYFQHRVALSERRVTLRELAVREGITGRFAEHIWSVVSRSGAGYPARESVDRWKALPAPTADREASVMQARAGCDELYKSLTTWPSWFFARGDLAAGGAGDESPLVFDDSSLKAQPTHSFSYVLGMTGRGRTVLPPAPGPWSTHLAFDCVNPTPGVKPVVIWRNPRVLFRAPAPPVEPTPPGVVAVVPRGPPVEAGLILSTLSLRSALPAGMAATFNFGTSPDGTALGPDDFATTGPVSFQLEIPADGTVLEFQAEAELGRDRNAVIRVMVSDRATGNTRDSLRRVLLGDPASAGYKTFRAGMAEYAALLPPNSHGEVNPADKDPVPAPFDNTYNSPEHDAFVIKVKYQRNDAFFTENLVDGADRARLEQAWNDLFSSWPYHDAYLGMLDDHYQLKLRSRRIADLDERQITALPAEARPYVVSLVKHYKDVQQTQALAEAGHMKDALAFATQAWRRPLTSTEKKRLKAFYQQSRTEQALEHDAAIRTLLARVLVSPAFLYRVETVDGPAEQPVNAWELASRLSFFLWSSIPDEDLRRAAASGELHDPAMLARQVRRMTADPKARRFATEFFGQWLGFYRFDEHRGVDTGRFPEFTEEVKVAMYDEAISTFEYLVRNGRPIRELLHADYTFLNQILAEFYGIEHEVKSTDAVVRVDGANAFNRGGVLRLGAVLTTTSAPLRTSPVKRGDWLLRRILGTPTPLPPADAGVLPGDPASFGGLTLREKLAEHKRNATCANCHLRIDPLGFPLEAFDAVGRTRATYADGTAVDVTGELADKSVIVGIDGLLGYLDQKEPLIMKTLAKKMLGFALGRTVQASDRVLLDELIAAGSNATFSDLAIKIVSSRQFRHREGQDKEPDASEPSRMAAVAEPRSAINPTSPR